MKPATPDDCSRAGVARVLLATTLCVASLPAAAQPLVPGVCDAAGAVPAVLAAVDENFDLLLGDGRVLTPSGIEFHTPPADPAALLAWFSDRELHVKALATTPDRWGRARARIYIRPQGATGASLSDGAVAALRLGWARYRPGADTHDCRPALLAAETEARERRMGLWADASSVLLGHDRQALAAATPTMLVVEGFVHSVGAARGRVYLNLGKMRTVDLAIVILGRNISAFEAQGVEPRKLAGHRIRVRGLLDRRSGPQIEITSPDALEIIEATGTDSRSGEAKGHTD